MTKAAAGGTGGGDGEGSEGKRKKKTQGRKKLPWKRIEDPNKLQVCFSKRRKGLFKKAQEVAVLCGAQVLAVVFSPAGRPYSYGYPSVPVVAGRLIRPWAHDAAAAAEAALRVRADLEGHERQAKGLEEELLLWRRKRGGDPVEAAGVWVDGDVQRWDLPHLEAALAALESVQVEAAERVHAAILAQEAMMQCTAAGGGGGSLLHCHEPGSFTADDGTGGIHHVMPPMDDTTMRLMAGDGGSFYSSSSGGSYTYGASSHEAAMNPMNSSVFHALAPAMPPPAGPPLHHGYDHAHGCYYFQRDDGGDHHHRRHGHGHLDLHQMQGIYGAPCSFLG